MDGHLKFDKSRLSEERPSSQRTIRVAPELLPWLPPGWRAAQQSQLVPFRVQSFCHVKEVQLVDCAFTADLS